MINPGAYITVELADGVRRSYIVVDYDHAKDVYNCIADPENEPFER